MSGQISYTASETGKLFHKSKAFVRLMLGAVGSGKSSAACNELMIQMLQTPVCKDNVIRNRAIIVRDTYPNLKSTTIKTWDTWFPSARFGNIKQDYPLNQKIAFMTQWGIPCELEFYFLSLGSEKDVEKLASLEAGWIYFNELSGIDASVFGTALMRVGRYPPENMLREPEKRRCGIIADSNYFSKLGWQYEEFFENRPGNYDVFEQPAPVLEDEHGELLANPLAENIENLPGGYDYYWRAISQETKHKDTVRRLILCKFGNSFEGKAVHPSYNELLHYTKYVIEPDKEHDLYLGFDFGGTPACAFMQLVNGQLRIIDELTSINSNLEEFLRNSVKPLLAQKYQGFRVTAPCDPAGVQKSQADGNYCLRVLAEHGLNPKPTYTNALMPRREALDDYINRLVCGAPALLVSIQCKVINEGLKGGFHYPKIMASGSKEPKYNPTPEKNSYSHICEALEYGALYLHTGTKGNMLKEEFYTEHGLTKMRLVRA